MTNDKGPHLLYKKLGETPYEAILRFKKESPEMENEPMTYAGRLDPMAEGLLLILSGEEVMNKEKYLKLPKTYEFQILWGFETDTLDILGKVLNEATYKPSEEQIRAELKKIGKFEQKYPAFSSKPVQGKPLFEWAREGRIKEIEIPLHEVEIFEADFMERRLIAKEELLVNTKFKIEAVRGDFRQKEIWERWFTELNEVDSNEFVVDTLRMTVSSGFYVRQFVKDLANSFGTLATTFHIKRTRIGGMDVAQSIK